MFFLSNIGKKHYIDEMLWILYQRDDHDGIELVRKLIFEHLAETSLLAANIHRLYMDTLYGKFTKKIMMQRQEEEASIISFNFDVLLHEDIDLESCFDYRMKFDWIDPNRDKIYARSNPIKLIKLNGSLDWGICPSCDKIHLYHTHLFGSFYNNKECTSRCNSSIQPFIVIPHERYKEIIDPLWILAEEELKSAYKVTVIGYSFPEYDKKVIDLFASALTSDVLLEVVTHCEGYEHKDRTRATTNLKYKRLFPALENKINICLNGFQGYLNNEFG